MFVNLQINTFRFYEKAIYHAVSFRILRYAEDIVANGFPTDAVFMVDDNWQKYYGNFEFKPDRFPDPKGMVDKLHKMGFKLMFWLHAELGPYLVEEARKGSVSGEPIVRPMDYAFPGQGFEGCADQYMLGEKYLVAPMQTPGTQRTVKLPKGRWQDEAGRKYKGGKVYTLDVPLDRIPVFTKVK